MLKDEGIELIDSHLAVEPMLAESGLMTRRALTADEQGDLDFGLRNGRRHAGLDIGRRSRLKHGAVVAVEAMEGTDR